jgi:hypothetical protein
MVALIVLLAASGCALSANADQGEPDNKQDQAAGANDPPAPQPTTIDKPTGNPRQPNRTENQQPTHNLREFVIERLIDPVTWFTGGLLLLALYQYRAMVRQAKHMEDGLTETRHSINEATRSATAMEDIAKSMAMSAESVRSSLAISREIADTNKEMVTSQRAFLSVVKILFGPEGPQRIPTLTLELTNAGNRPPTIIEFATAVYTQEELASPNSQIDPSKWSPAHGVTPPGGLLTLTAEQGANFFTPERWQQVHSGDLPLSFHAVVRYDTGVPGVIGETSVGGVYRAHTRSFAMTHVPGYNYAK